MPSVEDERFALLPTTRHVAPLAVLVGALLALLASSAALRLWSALAAGALLLLSLLLLRRRPVLVLGADGYRVEVRGKVRFAVAFSEVRRVLCDAGERALYVDCGEPGRNLLLPPARGYAFTFARRERLYRALTAGPLSDRLVPVANLERGPYTAQLEPSQTKGPEEL